MRRRAVVAAVAGWVTVVGVSSAAAWVAIDRAGREVLTAPSSGLGSGRTVATGAPRTPVGTGADVDAVRTHSTSSSGPRPSTPPTRSPATPSGQSTSSGTRSSSPASTQATTATTAVVDRTVRVEGGQAGVRCVGRTASLRFAQPTDGWSVKVEDDPGPQKVKLSFVASDRHREIEVEAECSTGTPVFSTSDDRHARSDD